ncbi:hypothetical protein RDABS01_000461 [Bienertia sinuspersici]
MWLSQEDCWKVVEEAWNGSMSMEAPSKLEWCASRLTEWAEATFGKIKKRIREAEKELKKLQDTRPDHNMLSRCDDLAKELDELHRREESYWHARARVNELKDGDKNTSYFHHKASQRKKRNLIRGLYNSQGAWCQTHEEIVAVVEDYFKGLFSSDNPTDFEAALAGLNGLVDNEMNETLDAEPSGEEIKNALFQMHPNKAPGPDGMHALFFQKFWNIVGNDIIYFVKSWWRGNQNLKNVNKTCVVLIPKCKDPQSIKEFRPISCCNVLYKIISKTMANKLKIFLGDIISKNQSAFVPKRLISDNALIAFEIFHYMKRKGEGRCGSLALKLDMSKAYDRVEWSFLERVMYRMGFSVNWVRRVLDCLSTVSFSFKINGKICGNETPSRGLRQGDPISPYLFLLCADAFSCLLSKAANEGRIHGARICRGAPRISHLFFVDDSLLFARATMQECFVITDIISLYERASGQKVNLDKTEVAFSKYVTIERRKEIVEKLGVNEVDKHEKYLGLPTIIGKSKKAIFASLKERIWKKLQGWKEKLLSNPGKETLIKAVAQAIPTYMMSIFKIPDGLIEEIHALMGRFWWGSNENGRKMHWLSWENLSMPKSLGGMGFRDLKCFNLALLAKQVWRLHVENDSLLHKVIKAKYFKHEDILEANRGFDPSFTWRSLWNAKSLLKEGMIWRVGNGSNINVWTDSWIQGDLGGYVLGQNDSRSPNMRVIDLMDAYSGKWNSELIKNIFSAEDCKRILATPLSSSNIADSRYWWPNKSGEYTVRSGYWLAKLGRSNGGDLVEQDTKMWRQRHVINDATCPLCGSEDETINHALLVCPNIANIWNVSDLKDKISNAPLAAFKEKWRWFSENLSKKEACSVGVLAWAAWLCRNKAVYEQPVHCNITIAAGFLGMVEEYLEYAAKVFQRPNNSVQWSNPNAWLPPPMGIVKINTDAHVLQGVKVGLGVVIRDNRGAIRAAAVKSLEPRSVEIAEAEAARYGLELARRLNYDKVVVEVDASNVFHAVNCPSKGYSPIYTIYDDIHLDGM